MHRSDTVKTLLMGKVVILEDTTESELSMKILSLYGRNTCNRPLLQN